MTHILKLSAVRASLLGLSALLATAFFLPSEASAAIDRNQLFTLGVIDEKSAAWDPAKGGSFSHRYYGDKPQWSSDFSWRGKVYSRAKVTGVLGNYDSGESRDTVTEQKPSATFENKYYFSLKNPASFKLEFTKGTGWRERFAEDLVVTLWGADGFRESVRLGRNDGEWIKEWSNLKAGQYGISVKGSFGFKDRTDYFAVDSLNQYYNGKFSVGPAGGDVPLPGALVLLGTALAGAGVYGRKRKAAKADA